MLTNTSSYASYLDASLKYHQKHYLDVCIKSAHTTEHHNVVCKLTQNSGVFILNIISVIKRAKDQNILKHKSFL